MPAKLPIIATPSRSETTARCYRRHSIADVAYMQRTGTVEPPLAFGTVIHAGSAEWWLTRDYNRVMQALHNSYHDPENYPHLVDNPKHTFALAVSMLEVYMEKATLMGDHFCKDEKEWSIIEIEERCELELPHGLLSFQMDRLLRFHSPSPTPYKLIDTKTAARLDTRWRDRWSRSLQMKLYAYGVKEKYGSVPLVEIEGVLKTVGSDVEYVLLPVWSDGELEEAVMLVDWFLQQDTRWLEKATLEDGSVDMVKLLELLLTKTPFNSDDCFAYYKPCPLLDCCSSLPEQRVSLLLSDFEEFVPKFLE